MVSFVCNYCQATLKKPKLDQHLQRCYNASFSCIDCNTDFVGDTYRQHTACMTEEQKYKNKMVAKKAFTPATPKVPKSTVDQLKEKQTDAAQVEVSKKRKHERSATEDKEKKEKKPNKNSGATLCWDDTLLPATPVDALANAITFVCRQEPGVAFAELRKKCVRMVTKHPQSTLPKSDVKDAFDAAVLTALSEGTVALTKC